MAPFLLAPLAPPGPPWESKNFLGCFWRLCKLKFEEILPKISRMQILGKLAPKALPLITIPPDSPGSQKFVWEVSGIYLSSSLKKYHQKYQECRYYKNCPPCGPLFTRPPDSPGSQKIFWDVSGIYLSSSLKKYHQKYQECRFCKDCPPCGPLITIPPDSPGSQKLFWDVSGIYLSSSLMKYHQKYHECRV